MRAYIRVGWWLVGIVVILQLLGLTDTALAQQELRAGTKELAIAGGYSISHNVPRSSLETVHGYDLIPHFGYVLTDERGSGWLSGNLELLAEPTLIHLDASKSATVGGLAGLGRWIFSGASNVRPYLEGGVGVLGGKVDLRQTNCDLNFILQGGAGAMVFVSESTALTLGYRFQHISNASRCTSNLGLNSSMFIVGVSYFFE